MENALADAVREQFDVELDVIVHERPPKPSLGDAAFPVAFDLARKAKMAPRKIAEALAPALSAARENAFEKAVTIEKDVEVARPGDFDAIDSVDGG